MSRVLLVHWNAGEAEERARRLRRAGHDADCVATGGELRGAVVRPPAAFVIDLARQPAQGCAVAVWLRGRKGTRHVPIVFIEGDPERTGRVRKLLPDAVYATWPRIASALRRALRRPPRRPVVPGTMAGYAGTPLPRKLGIAAGTRASLLGAPAGFERTLGALPEGARLRRAARGPARVVLLFVRSRAELGRRFPAAARRVERGGRLWIAWPKRGSALETDLTPGAVRATGLGAGWVDFKIAAIDETWSGLCFARRAG